MGTSRILRISLLVILAVAVASAAKITLDKLATHNLAAAQRMAQDRVSADTQVLNKVTAAIAADRQMVDRLAKEVVPTKQEMYLTRPIHAGDTFAGMVGDSGFQFAGDSPFRVRTVPDPEAAAKLASNRKAAADKLAADEAADKVAADKLAKDVATADRLAKRTARWRDAFGVAEVHE